ncbi:MAG: DUF4394 domain-containing protein [Acidobacteria bacterium]|nr:DUF4394 domain-containing protein [Acidobacteriota bacterium]
MKKTNAKKLFAVLTFSSLALTALLTLTLMSSPSASAESELSLSNTSYSQTTSSSSSSSVSVATQTGIVMPRTPIYAMDTDNTLFVLVPGTTAFVRLVRVADAPVNGNFIGCDFRPANGNNNVIYAVTDTGNIYTIGLTAGTLGKATLISTMTPGLPSGYQSLADFNPVVDALRLIGSDTLNYAVVNNGANLAATAIQTSLTYNANDVAKGISPRVSAGSYTNNFPGAAATIFYGLDYNRDTLVTIDPAAAGGSSATGGGVLRTIGNLVTPANAPIKVSPTADIDIYTLSNGANRLVGVSGRTFFTIDLAQATQAAALGTTTNVVVRGIAAAADTGGRLLDISAAPTYYQAENALQGGGNKVDTNIPGFIGTGFVNFTDNAAGGFTEFAVNQAGTQTVIFRYSNGSKANRPCNVTVNGVSVGNVAFAPTGSFGTYGTATLSVNLGAGGSFRALRITSTTAAGGPNLDTIYVE